MKMDVIEAINKRYSAKLFTGKKIPEEDILKLKEAIRFAPSWFNIQPWKIKVVEDKEMLSKLQQAAYGQKQVGTASHLFVFCSINNFDENNSKIVDKMKQKEIKILYEADHQKVYEYLNIADIGIVPSRSEWFGLAGAEFSKFWKTTVLANIWGIPEINYWDCHFFSVDNKQEFLKCFKEIFDKKVNNYWHDKNLTIKNMLEQYKKVYKIEK